MYKLSVRMKLGMRIKPRFFSPKFPTYQFLENVCHHDFVILQPVCEEFSGVTY